MASAMGALECPMCDFTVASSDDYGPELLQLHFEQVHTTDSPFRIVDGAESPPPSLPPRPSSKRKHVADTPSSDEEEDTVTCPESDCGEVVLLTNFNEHLDYHAAETLSFDETTGEYHSNHSSATMHGLTASNPHKSYTKRSFPEDDFNDGHGHKLKKHGHRDRSNTTSSEKSTLSRSIISFNPFTKADKSVKPPDKSARLGKSELGPYAWEDRMPRWLHDQLAAGPKITVVNRIGRDGRLIKQEQVQNETTGIIPILAQLSALDRSVKEAYYCHPSTLHIGKTPREGGFCGYRNIQMLLSYIQGAKAQGHEEFPGRTPGILKLQDLIERAWDKGINQIGRIQTGGIRDTRKYIGTPEAQAFFLSSEINCAVEMFSDNKERKIEAHETLLDAIERYFAQAAVKDGSNVYKTLLPPIYLQQPGHSITIVGFERRRDGACNLVVFDPMYSTSPVMHKLLGRKNIRTARPEVMHAYRRGARQLRKHAAFEILMLTATPPLFPAWDVLRQFPDCRFVYAFFRSRTLGYDVYPEDYFLPNFPWQQYGGLWVCDEARFARAEPFNALNAQALRRITSEGASTRSSSSNSPTSPFTSSGFSHFPAADAHMSAESQARLPSYVPSLDGSIGVFTATTQRSGSGPVYNMGGLSAALLQPEMIRPNLSLLTDVGRKYPGFPTPLSPTLSAKELFPSPASEPGGGVPTPRASSLNSPNSPAVRSVSPMSVDGSEMCGPLRHCLSHGFDHYVSSMGLIDSIISYGTRLDSSPASYSRSPSSCSQSPISPTSPPRATSPRVVMLKKMIDKQAFQDLSHNPTRDPAPILELHPKTVNAYPSPPSTASNTSASPRRWPPHPPSISIANGTETALTSPISPTGIVLAYTSHRPVDSGLLGVRPLSEAQVAEYRFWRPCGKRACAFGCGSAKEGELGAARRLFRGVEDLDEKEAGVVKREGEAACDGHSEDDGGETETAVEERYRASVWAGRTLVTDWGRFLGECEREGVARF
ncbi:DUF1671-domain-containing protein [Setomelanomma holmii]|uniref:DUF1671-domain-containing protein n=1 Tax=Setomelanomma holmii TaxID=210430 RepID=A0A9P4H1H4_9PLEO|nr:DUF1671-domain-containing protein [Setomelanomma holmii]